MWSLFFKCSLKNSTFNKSTLFEFNTINPRYIIYNMLLV